MSASDAMFEASSVYFEYVYERTAHVKYTVFPVGVDLDCSKSLIFVVVGWFSTPGVL